MPDVLVTGLPRSGLTLAGALIDTLPNSICLNEPQVQGAQARKLRETIPYCKWLGGDFIWQRSLIKSSQHVSDYRAENGAPLLDSIKDPNLIRNDDGHPQQIGYVHLGLTGDFTLAMKQSSLYTCLLPTLIEMRHFIIIAIVRHPYDVIQSWLSLPNEPIGQGKIPFALHYWPEASLTDNEQPVGDLMDRFVQIYDLFMKRYHENKDNISIIKYENMIDEPGLISLAVGSKSNSTIASKIDLKRRVREQDILDNLRARFKKYGTYTRYFYPDVC